MFKPLISVLVVSYNHEPYLSECIESIVNQTYDNTEIVVADDCSLDRSQSKIISLKDKYGFKTLFNTENYGLNETILRALPLMTGEFISLVSADDILLTNKLQIQYDFLVKNNTDGVYATGYLFDDQSKSMDLINVDDIFNSNSKSDILEFLYTKDWGAPLLQSALFKRDTFFKLAPLRKKFKSDDWAFIIEAFRTQSILYMNEPVFLYRLHDSNTHKKYWFTFPMRVEVVSLLVPDKLKARAFGNIFYSQAEYLLKSNNYFFALRFFFSSMLFSFSMRRLYSFVFLMVYRVYKSIKL